MELLKEHFRHLLLSFNKKETTVDSHQKLIKTYRESSPIKRVNTGLDGSEVVILMSVTKSTQDSQKNLKMQNCKNYRTKTQFNPLQN